MAEPVVQNRRAVLPFSGAATSSTASPGPLLAAMPGCCQVSDLGVVRSSSGTCQRRLSASRPESSAPGRDGRLDELEVAVSVRSALAKGVNAGLRPLGAQLVRGTSADPAVETFLPARKTIAAARKSGLSVGGYIDQTFVKPGATQDLIREMLKLAGLSADDCDTICEIGPGSGRFGEVLIAELNPKAYEIYETARDWLPHLRQLPNVVVRDCDGHSLRPTPDASVDLVHAQKVFVYLKFYVVIGYLEEMARVVRPGGIAAFDVVTGDCLDEEMAQAWVRQGSMYHAAPRDWIVEFMKRHGMQLVGSCFTPLTPGRSELLVFRRD